MSELAKLLRQITRAEPAPLGFGRGPSKRSATMLLVALVSERWARGAADAAAGGADLVLLAGRQHEKELAEAVAAADGRPCGLLSAQHDTDQLSKLREAGLDFAVVELDAPARALVDQELGLVLHLRDDLADIQLRTLEGLPFEAVYLDVDTSSLSILGQMDLQRVSGLARKPLLVTVAADAEQGDLLSLRDAGVVLVALDLKERGATEALPRLRGVIDALPARRRPRGEERAEVTLPGAAHGVDGEDEEDEFE